jgi:hypothetical protein
MSARAHIDLSQYIKNLLELPLNDFINETDNIKSYVSYYNYQVFFYFLNNEGVYNR